MTTREEEMNQPTLFDPPQAKAAADEGMAQALHAERVAQWKLDADEWLEAQESETEFTTDDLIRDIGPADFGANRNNVVGAWTNSKSRLGYIRFAGRLRKSERVSRHGNLQRVWVVA